MAECIMYLQTHIKIQYIDSERERVCVVCDIQHQVLVQLLNTSRFDSLKEIHHTFCLESL